MSNEIKHKIKLLYKIKETKKLLKWRREKIEQEGLLMDQREWQLLLSIISFFIYIYKKKSKLN